METIDDGDQMLAITELGFGKRTRLSEYPLQGRGGQGVKTLNITDKTADVAACHIVQPGQKLMLVSRDGIVILTNVDSISVLGRNTQGVTVMRVSPGDQVASIAAFTMQDEGPNRAERREAELDANRAQPNGHADTPLNETMPLDLDDGDDEAEDDEE